MGQTPSVKLENGPVSAPSDPVEYDGFQEVRFQEGPGGHVHLYLSRSGDSVAYFDGTKWTVTDGNAIGDPGLDGEWTIILGQAK